MFKQFILFCLCLLCASGTFAQSEQNELNGLVQATQSAYDRNSDSLQYYAERAAKLAIKLGDINSEIRVQQLWGIKLFLNGQSDQATKILMDVARHAEQHPVTIQSATLYYSLAQVYSKNEYADISEKYLRKGLEIARKFKNDTTLADGYNRIGIFLERKNDLDSALYFYQRAFDLCSQMQVTLGMAYSLENLAGIYAKRNDLKNALRCQKQSLVFKNQSGKKLDVAIAYINIAESLDSLKQYDSSIIYTQKAIDLAKELNYKDLLQYSYQFLSGIFEQKGQYDRALELHKMYALLNDTIFNETKTKQLAEADKKYQSEKHQQQIKELSHLSTIQTLKLRQRNILLFISLGLLLITALVAYLVYHRRKLKAEARLQAEINRQQAITTREVLNAEEKERKRIAADLHDGVGQLLSASLMNLNGFFAKNNIDKTKNTEADRILSLVSKSYSELRDISHQLMPKALAKSGLESAIQELISGIDPDQLSITFDTSGLQTRLPEEIESVIFRVIQESLNNAVKHAHAKNLNIQVVKDEDGISVTIEDDGQGFDPKKLSKPGMGLKNIYSRVQVQNGSVEIDTQPGKGTLVAVHFPA